MVIHCPHCRGQITVTRTLRPGGRLRIQAVGEDGARLPAHVRVFDESGAQVEVELCVRTESQGMVISHSRPGHLSTDGPTTVDPALEEGRYDFEFTLEGYRELLVAVEIEAGRTTELSYELERR